MDRRSERIERDIAEIKTDIKAIVPRLTGFIFCWHSKIENIKQPLSFCESKLNIYPSE